MNKDVQIIIKRILKDLKVELGDEFDQNFERQAFFSEAWARRRSPTRPGGSTLIDSGQLRRSVKSRTKDSSIVFYSDVPYAAIHNEGGDIVVTPRMKRFFRAKFYETQGGFSRKKNNAHKPLSDGGFYAWTSKMNLNTESEFWRIMALMRVGEKIKIPKRKFVGHNPAVEKIITGIIEDNLSEYLEKEFKLTNNQK